MLGVAEALAKSKIKPKRSISVAAAAEQDYEEFGKKDVSTMTGEQVKAALLEAGLFSFIIQRPYIVVADPNAKPKGISFLHLIPTHWLPISNSF